MDLNLTDSVQVSYHTRKTACDIINLFKTSTQERTFLLHRQYTFSCFVGLCPQNMEKLFKSSLTSQAVGLLCAQNKKAFKGFFILCAK